jgi:outer membrane lipoprotein SlyB
VKYTDPDGNSSQAVGFAFGFVVGGIAGGISAYYQKGNILAGAAGGAVGGGITGIMVASGVPISVASSLVHIVIQPEMKQLPQQALVLLQI